MRTMFSEYIGYDDDGVLTVDGLRCRDLLERFDSPLFVVSDRAAARFGFRDRALVSAKGCGVQERKRSSAYAEGKPAAALHSSCDSPPSAAAAAESSAAEATSTGVTRGAFS